MSLVLKDEPLEGVCRLTLNRPAKRNALTTELRESVAEAVGEAAADGGVRVILLTGAGGHFCAGGDLASLEGMGAADGRRRIQSGHRLQRLIMDCAKPVVAAVEGYAMGAGAGLAMAADTVVMDADTTIGFPFLKVGLGPDFATSYILPRRVGLQLARQALLRARNFKGEEAVRLGFGDELADTGHVQEKALEICEQYREAAPLALELTKRQLASAPQSLDAALEMEATMQALCFESAEFAEGVAAFKEKRKPRFR
ncbi:enoyl-CoA hydratase/isomerase family protein [Ferruginivarius sediminum]|uniref:Enoyl-CoA hydratase/isomerase family protein n=1 Tax=Ferruginivarius sediminum TaxID=2661937 RepID=A0A369TDV1_9PROT|nr:enoyl-CoA hydratase/isomerase family protein [Ferruginivarius sediminum]RDD62337.1 enoyl-CoA hydratase/isomerase family protein [Ferruginivarius sediminum]